LKIGIKSINKLGENLKIQLSSSENNWSSLISGKMNRILIRARNKNKDTPITLDIFVQSKSGRRKTVYRFKVLLALRAHLMLQVRAPRNLFKALGGDILWKKEPICVNLNALNWDYIKLIKLEKPVNVSDEYSLARGHNFSLIKTSKTFIKPISKIVQIILEKPVLKQIILLKLRDLISNKVNTLLELKVPDDRKRTWLEWIGSKTLGEQPLKGRILFNDPQCD